MLNFDLAAYDPLFYTHHANIDRFFEAWKILYQRDWDTFKRNPPDKKFSFTDGDGSRRSVKLDQLLETKPLGYDYDLPHGLSVVRPAVSTAFSAIIKPNQRYALYLRNERLVQLSGYYLLRFRDQQISRNIGNLGSFPSDNMPGMRGTESSFLVDTDIAVRIHNNKGSFEVIRVDADAPPTRLSIRKVDPTLRLLEFSAPNPHA